MTRNTWQPWGPPLPVSTEDLCRRCQGSTGSVILVSGADRRGSPVKILRQLTSSGCLVPGASCPGAANWRPLPPSSGVAISMSQGPSPQRPAEILGLRWEADIRLQETPPVRSKQLSVSTARVAALKRSHGRLNSVPRPARTAEQRRASVVHRQGFTTVRVDSCRDLWAQRRRTRII